ncbi:MAG TPA: Rrf2 family transcriptional regulator [Gallionellaceae bacterium]
MQLTQYTDYSYRVLIFLAQKRNGLSTVTEIAEFYGISRNHLVKVIHNLASKGFITTMRGRHGGMTLSRAPAEINLGDVARQTEPNFNIAECFDAEHNHCVITANCALKGMLFQARKAFLDTLSQYTLADVMKDMKLFDLANLPIASTRNLKRS